MKIGIFEILRADKNVWGLPNFLTLARLAFLPIIIYFINQHTVKGDWLALLFIFCSGVSDYFDGYFARKLNKTSELGKMLDPLIDKLLIGVLMLFLAAYKELPYWYVGMVIFRDILILIASLYLIKHLRDIAQSNMLGKWTLTSYVFVIMFYMVNFYPFNVIVMWTSVILIPVSLVTYFRNYKNLFTKDKAQ
jgi:CDP-diacylglycerol--glycerol-3-phosphate 3-phosphatidyltransferase